MAFTRSGSPWTASGRLLRERPRLDVDARECAVPLLKPHASQEGALDAEHCHLFCHSLYYLIFAVAVQGAMPPKPQIEYQKADARASPQ